MPPTVPAALIAIADLVLPRSCASCARLGRPVCAPCLAELDRAGAEAFAARPSPCPRHFPATWSQTTYDGVAAEVLRQFKDGARRDVGAVLGALLRGAVAAALTGDDRCVRELCVGRPVLVVPMPSRRSATRSRGREPTLELARHVVAGPAGLRLCRALRVVGRARDQAGLDAAQRAANVAGSVRVTARGRSEVPGRVCVIVDDIVTTGSSINQAGTALREAGAAQVVAATVAATQREHAGPGRVVYG